MNTQTVEHSILCVTAILCLVLAVVAVGSVLYLAISLAAQSVSALPYR